MPLFFIEMGQGIIAKGNFRVITSALRTCTLICGYNRFSGYGGAFHYPANQFTNAQTRSEMEMWHLLLKPTSIILVFPIENLYMMMGVSLDDRERLEGWAEGRVGAANVATRTATAVGMRLENNVMIAGNIAADSDAPLAGDYITAPVDLRHERVGTSYDNGGYTIVGRNQEG